jgi:hypothetical protein
MIKRITKRTALLIALLPACTFAATGNAGGPIGKALRSAMQQHLAAQGVICLGKFDWPIEVSELDFQQGTRDAVQMPVLEQLGLVVSSQDSIAPKDAATEEQVTIRRYTMTEAGQRYYLSKEVTTGSGAKKVAHHRDLCPARLSLDKITRWEAPRAVGDTQETLLSYTYTIDAPDWTRDPAAQKAFPMLDRIIKGAGSLQLQQRMRLTKQGWVAIGPAE